LRRGLNAARAAWDEQMATTVLDELVVKIVLNGQEFQAQLNTADQGVKKFAQQTAQSATVAERGAQKMVDGFSRVTKEILGVGAAILGVNGLKDLAVNLTQVAAATERMSEAFEIDPEMLNKWQGFLRAVGNQDFGTTAASLGALSKAVQEFRLTQKGPLLDAIPWLGRLGVSPADIMSGTVSQAVNSMLLKIGGNVNRPENAGVRTELLSHLPGMTPTMMRGLERAPTQATLDKYLTATAEQMHSASRMMEAITELALAMTKKLNAMLPDAESAVTLVPDIVSGKQPILHPKSDLSKNPLTILMQELGLLPGTLTSGGSDVHGPTSVIGRRRAAERNAVPPQTLFPDPGPLGVPPIPLDTSTMPQTNRFPDGSRRGGNVTHNNITANISAPKSDDPRMWGDIWADRVKAAMATGGAH